jgi:hypothetical protein
VGQYRITTALHWKETPFAGCFTSHRDARNEGVRGSIPRVGFLARYEPETE